MTGSCNPHMWTPEEDAQLRALLFDERRLTYAQIAEEMGLTSKQVSWRRDRCKLLKGVCRFNQHKWTPEEHETMRALLDEGLPASEVGRRMGRTKNAIIGRRHRTGLCEERYAGPTSKERLDALKDRMDAALAESAAIPRLPVPARSNTGRAEARQRDGFGVRALGYGQNGSGAVRALTGTFR